MKNHSLTTLAVILSTVIFAACTVETPTPQPITATPAPALLGIPTDDPAATFAGGAALDSSKATPENEMPPIVNQVEVIGGFFAQLSHDQKLIAIAKKNTMCAYQADTLALQWCVANPVENVPLAVPPAWSQDDKVVASAVFNKALLWDAATGHVQAVTAPSDAQDVINAIFSGDSCQGLFLVGFNTGQVGILNPATATYEKVVDASKSGVFNMAWSKCGTQLVSVARDRTLTIRDIDARRDLYRLEALDSAPNWSPDHSAFVLGVNKRVVIVTPGQGQPVVRSLALSDSAIAWANWSPDGRIVVATNQSGTTLWDAASGKPLYHLPTPAGVVFSPDSSKFVAIEKSGLATVWEMSGGKLLYKFTDVQNVIFDPATPGRVFFVQKGALTTRQLK